MKPVNSVLLAFKGWKDKKIKLHPLLKTGTTDERAMLARQLEHLRQQNKKPEIIMKALRRVQKNGHKVS